MTLDRNALKACPFCGGRSLTVEDNNDLSHLHFWVACDDCDSEGPWRGTEAEAIEAWNRRAALPEPVQPVAWRWWELMHDSMGGWERKIESYPPPDRLKPEDVRDVEPLYATPPASAGPALAAELAQCREALSPFGTYLDQASFDLDNNGNPIPDGQGMGWVYLTVGDFRRARTTLKGTSHEPAILSEQGDG